MEQDQLEYQLVYIHGRANLKTLILDQKQSALEKTNKIENYYGFENGISGKELFETGIKQANNIGVEVQKQEVIKIERSEDGYDVKTERNNYKAKAIILATGNKKNKPNIKKIEDFEGRGVSYCAICDGFFYRNKNVSVIGNGKYAISEVNDLLHLAEKVTILTNGEKAPEMRGCCEDNVEVNTKEIETVAGEKKIEEVVFKDGTTLKTDGIFIATRCSRKYGIC